MKLKIVSSPKSDKFGRFPMIRKLIEYRADIVKIPAKRLSILNRVDKNAVTHPTIAPAIAAIPIAKNGFIPRVTKMADTAAPKGKLPSTVKSGNFKTRKERNTPIDTKL